MTQTPDLRPRWLKLVDALPRFRWVGLAIVLGYFLMFLLLRNGL
jgi:hypothetical protein